MRKLYYLIILTVILGLVLTGCLLSNVGQVPTSEQSGIAYLTKNTEGGLFTTDLIAGGGNLKSAIDVGDVLVWNDGDTLYVQYVVTAPWYLTETHLHVALSPEEIPQKKGNPPPGKFDYKGEHAYETLVLHEIPLEWNPEVSLYIAAHAVVVDTNSTQTVPMVSNEGDTVYGPLDPISYNKTLADFRDNTWGDPNTAVIAVNSLSYPYDWGGSRSGVDIVGVSWISTETYTEDNGTADSWRWFTEDLEVSKYPVPNSGELLINADNEYWAYLNGTQIGTDNHLFPPPQDCIESLIFDPIMDTNTFDFLVKNDEGFSIDGNPNGLTYKVTADYYDRIETAWAAGTDFPGKNWATYFTYTVQEYLELVDTVTVDSKVEDGKDSSITLEDEADYRFKVSGTWANKPTDPHNVDAKYISFDNWVSWLDAYPERDFRALELQVNEEFVVDWGDYSPEHTYYLDFVGEGATVNFRVFEGDPENIPISSWYGDNSGSLAVEIYWIP